MPARPSWARLEPELGNVSNGMAALLMGVSDERQCASSAAPVPKKLARSTLVSPPPVLQVSQSPHGERRERGEKDGEEEEKLARTYAHRHTDTHARAWFRYKMPLFRGQCASTSVTLGQWTF